MSTNDSAHEAPIDGTDAWLDDLLSGIEKDVSQRKGQVIIFNDDYSPAPLVAALIALVLGPDEDPMKADYLMHKIHFEGQATVFEGPLTECDQVYQTVSQGEISEAWIDTVIDVTPQLRMHDESLAAMQVMKDADAIPEEIMRQITEFEEMGSARDIVRNMYPPPQMTAKVLDVG